METEAIVQGLVTSGPLAGVLALAVYRLWHELRATRTQLDELNREIRQLLQSAAGMGESRGGDRGNGA